MGLNLKGEPWSTLDLRMAQLHHSSISKLEDSTVKPPKTVNYMPVSALCAESTYSNTILKLKFKFGWGNYKYKQLQKKQ